MPANEGNPERNEILAAGGGVVELAPLLPRDDFSALERHAAAEGITTARLLRRAVWEYLTPRLTGPGRPTAEDRPTNAHEREERLVTSVPHLPLKVVPGSAHPVLAGQLARELGGSPAGVEVGSFADGEARVRITDDVRGTHAVVVQPTGPPVNDNLMGLALLADAARAAGAERVTAVVPYFGYARQDRREHPGEPRSAQVAGRLLAAVGIDHLVALDLHSPALESALPMPATLLGSDDLFLPRVAAWGLREPVVVSPDAGGLKRAQRYAAALNAPVAVVAKNRPRPDEAAVQQVLGDVKGRVCLVVDDMASTGRTLAGAADALRRAGARETHAVFTHAVMAPGAADRIRAAGFGKVMTTDSVPVPALPGVEVVPIAPLLARAVWELCGEK